MKKLFLLMPFFLIISLVCMQQQSKRKKELFHKNFFSPELVKALCATLLEESWQYYAPSALTQQVKHADTAEFEYFIAQQTQLQQDSLKRNTQKSLTKHGLTLISYTLKDDPIWYYKKKYFKQWLRSTLENNPVTDQPNPIFTHIPDEHKKEFVKDVVERYLQYVPYESYPNAGIINSVKYNRIGKSHAVTQPRNIQSDEISKHLSTQSKN